MSGRSSARVIHLCGAGGIPSAECANYFTYETIDRDGVQGEGRRSQRTSRGDGRITAGDQHPGVLRDG